MDYFIRVTKSSNKYGQDRLKNENFGGMKWKNITVQDIIHFYGVMLRMSIYTWHLGGYTSYFESISRISCVQGYMVSF